jgi:large subunit ribosomal protein L10e
MTKQSGGMAYTRHEYISSIPQTRIVRFTHGEPRSDYKYIVSLVAPYATEISSRALESTRVTANKVLSSVGGLSYFFQIKVYPHRVIRQHKFMGFAGADRLSQGMKRAFGRPTGRSARVNPGQPILSVQVNDDGMGVARNALTRASKKLPIPCKIVVDKVAEHAE